MFRHGAYIMYCLYMYIYVLSVIHEVYYIFFMEIYMLWKTDICQRVFYPKILWMVFTVVITMLCVTLNTIYMRTNTMWNENRFVFLCLC